MCLIQAKDMVNKDFSDKTRKEDNNKLDFIKRISLKNDK